MSAELEALGAFRAGVYVCFGPRRDALFELLDAATTTQVGWRRRWST